MPGAPGLRLWFCDTRSAREPALLARYRDLLDPTEIARLERFRFERDRHSFLVSHALLRTVLADAVDADASALRFGVGEHGKPCLIAPRPRSGVGVSFNLSHSGSQAVVAVCPGEGMLGVDLEFHRPDRRFRQLAERHFADVECDLLGALADRAQCGLFYDIWTLKEAYLKARGTGLQLPLQAFAFYLGQDGLSFDAHPGLDDHPGRWRFWCARLAGAYSVSIALESQVALAPESFLLTPLVEVRPLAVERLVSRSR